MRRRGFFDTFLPKQKKRTLASVAFGQSLKAAATTAAARNSSARVARGKMLEAWLVDAPNAVGPLQQGRDAQSLFSIAMQTFANDNDCCCPSLSSDLL